jgi:alpha-L-fucosidase 2
MNRRDFLQISGGAALLTTATVGAEYRAAASGLGRPVKRLHRVVSRKPPIRWEDALISGNGSTGVMVMGLPFEDLVVVNHAKLWVVGSDVRPQAPDLREVWRKARIIARQGKYRDADEYARKETQRIVREMYAAGGKPGSHPWYDRTHPGFHLHVTTESNGSPSAYQRTTNLETGEISVSWTDARGDWLRRTFVSRTHDAIVMELTSPAGSTLNATLRLTEAPGKLDGDLRSVVVEHGGNELYFRAAYGRTMGKADAEGYHALARVSVQGGKSRAVANERLDIRGASRILVVMRLEYLENAARADRAALRRSLANVPAEYEALLAPHAMVHGEMFRRVSLELGGDAGSVASSEELIARAATGESLPQFFELMHAAGRYALICGGSGVLPPSLMGIWGNRWDPPWDGRYTFDANLNLAIAAASQGNLPEVMTAYTAFLERSAPDWRENARGLYGCRGVVTDLCQGRRHGTVLMTTYPWTGGAGWLAWYLYDHYLFTQDRRFLKDHVVPLLKEVAEFYDDFLPGFPELNGRAVFYPSISPENWPRMTPEDQSTNVVPNATCEIAICREAITQLLAACRELGIESQNIARWESLLARLPDYVVNKDGALAEWSYPGLGDRYEHRHSSHLYGIYPSLEISPDRTPELFKAARVAMEKRLAAGLGHKEAHGLLHVSLVAARLKSADLMRRMLDEFARLPFVNTSFTTCHNPGPSIYNLDATFCMPAVLIEMLVYSEPGLVELLPALPQDRFPRGVLRGVLARGGATIVELRWDMPARRIDVTLWSARPQQLTLRCGAPMRSIEVLGPSDVKLLSHEAKRGWQVRLEANQTVRLTCSI